MRAAGFAVLAVLLAADARGQVGLVLPPPPAAGLPEGGIPWRGTVRIRTGRQAIRAIAFSPDGRTLASAGDDAEITLQDAASGEMRRALAGHASFVNGIAFSPDGRTLASAGWDRTVRLWDPAVRRPLRSWPVDARGIFAVAFSPDGRGIATAGLGGAIRIREAATGRETRAFDAGGQLVTGIAFSPDGRALASGGSDGSVRLWDLRAGGERWLGEGRGAPVFSVAFSPDGRRVAASGEDGVVSVWEVSTGEARPRFRGGERGILCLAFSPDGRAIAAGGTDEAARLFDAATGAERCVLRAREGDVLSLAFSPGGGTLATGTRDGSLRLWNAGAAGIPRTFKGCRGAVLYMEFSEDGTALSAWDNEFETSAWALATGQPVAEPAAPVARRIPTVSPPEEGASFVPRGEGESEIIAWTGSRPKRGSSSLGRACIAVPAPFSAGGGEGVSSDGGMIAGPGPEGSIRFVWEAVFADGGGTAEAPASVLVRSAGMVPRCLAASRDGAVLAAGCADGTVRLFEVATCREFQRLCGHRQAVTAVAFAPDGRTLASGCDDASVFVWDVSPGAAPAGAVPEDLWGLLGREDPVEALPAVEALAASPERSVPLLRSRLRPVSDAAPRVRGLLAALDDDDYAAREAASEELFRLGPAAWPDLREASGRDPPEEVRARIAVLLEPGPPEVPVPCPETRRALRAIRALERASTAEALGALEEISTGLPRAAETRAAKLALARLRKDRPAP